MDSDTRGTWRVDDLVARAAAGDAEAAGVYLQSVLPYLRAMAVRVALPAFDPDDVLSEAITRLLSKWQDGTGPTEYAHTYVIRTMRNIVVDEARSPRSRTAVLEDEQDLLEDESVSTQARRVELAEEYALVREGFAMLSDDQRRVLEEVIIGGRKPAELTEELARNAPAVSNLLKRAKASLRRSVLVASLGRGRAACALNATEIPLAPHLDWQEHERHERGLPHVIDCVDCQHNWRRWASLTSALGISVALVLANLARPLPASAASVSQGDATGRRRPSPDVLPVSAESATAAEPTVIAPTTAAPESGLSPATRSRARAGLPVTSIALVLGAVVVVAGVALTALSVQTWRDSQAEKPPGVLTVSPESDDALFIGFEVRAAQWRAESVTIAVTGGTVVGVPDRWTCSGSSREQHCDPGVGPVSGGVRLIRDDPAADVTYRVTVHAVAGEYSVDGTEEGTIPPD